MSEAIKSMDDIVALCRRRGFIWQSSEIYGGINGFWDYGPLGAQLKRNLKDAWWSDIVTADKLGPDGSPFDIVPVDCTIIMHPKVWEASGHVAGFNDPMVDCTETKKRYRADKVWVVGFNNVQSVVNWAESVGDDLSAVVKLLDLVKSGAGEHDIGEQLSEAMAASQSVTPSRQISDVMIAVEADSAGQALQFAASKLNRRQKEILDWDFIEGILNTPDLFASWTKQAEDVFLGRILRIHNQLDIPDYWPRLSPATQQPTLTEPRAFNLMFQTYIGATATEEDKSYLRPETAQGIFTQFWNVVDTSRVKVPFGIAQQGKAFRNEVTPRNFTFRSREFEQMEIEFFIHPSQAKDWYKYWCEKRFAWWESIGLAGDNLTMRPHDPDELAHYAKDGEGTSDVEYRFPFTAPGYGELEGVAHRADFDLRAHANMCGKGEKMRYFDQERNEHYFPHVIEPSAGADRGTLALLCEAYTPTPDRSGSKAIMRFTPRMAPIKAAIFPLVNKDGMPEVAEKLYKQLKQRWNVQMDVKQSIGKRYARMDEAGTPFCFTVDTDTLSDQTVTVRDRDTAEQSRVAIDRVERFLAEKIGG